MSEDIILKSIVAEVHLQIGINLNPNDLKKLNARPVQKGYVTFDSFAAQTADTGVFVQRFSDGNIKVHTVA